jgi:hypothetical protein
MAYSFLMKEGEDDPMFVSVSSDRAEAEFVEIPNLNELLGDRIEGLSHDARTFLKLQMLLRDQDFIGRMHNEDSIFAMFQEMIQGGYLPRESIQDAYHTLLATYEDFKASVIQEAEELGIPIASADPSNPTRLQ